MVFCEIAYFTKALEHITLTLIYFPRAWLESYVFFRILRRLKYMFGPEIDTRFYLSS